jgi:hypothetical protein
MKSRQGSSTKKRYQVFLSYASADKQVARNIVDKLRQEGIRVWFDTYELQPADSIAEVMEKVLSASDYLVVLLSPHSVNSVWVQQELGAALSSDLTARDITLLPVLIADCEIPPPLAYYQYLDLRTDFEQGVNRLVKQISAAPEIDFSELDGRAFEDLVADLLAELGFRNIDRKFAISDFGVDIKAQYSHPDPFGVEVTDTWLVEIKFYRQGRADLKSMHQLVGYLSGLPARSKGLLITNGQLTSAARDWLKSTEASSRVEIRVIDGTELKRLLLQHRDLIERYFTGELGQ